MRFLTLHIATAAAMAGAALAEAPTNTAALYDTRKVWEIGLQFTADQWKAIEPGRRAGGFGFGGPPGGPGGPGGRAFGPGTFLARPFMKALDANQDGLLTKDEFTGGFDRWFTKWDAVHSGALDEAALRDGLNKELASGEPPAGGPPPMNLANRTAGRNGVSAMAGIEFHYVHADLTFADATFSDIGIRYKGNGTYLQSQQSEKRSFKIDLAKYQPGQKLAGVTKLTLNSNVTDASWMNEVLSYALFRDAGVPAPRTAYARVTVTAPGTYDHEYFGLYSLVEDPDSKWAREQFGKKGGMILKPSTRDLFKYEGTDWSKYEQAYDPKSDVSDEQKERFYAFAKLVTEADDVEFARQLPEFLDLDEFARFMAVTAWLSTMDSILAMGQNFVVYLHPKTNRFQFVPWDLDHSFGNFGMIGSQEQRERLSIRHPWVGANRFLERVMKVEAVRTLYLAKLAEFQKTIFQPARLQAQVDELAPVLRDAVQAEDPGKAERFDKVVSGESVSPAGFGPGGPRPPGDQPRPSGPEAAAPEPTPRPDGGGGAPEGGQNAGPGGPGFRGGFMQPAKPIKKFVEARYASVADQLAGKSEGEQINPFGGGRPGGGGPFGPGNFLARAIREAADTDHDGKVTQAEFTALAAKWYGDWSATAPEGLTEEQLAAGLSKAFPFPRPPGGPPAP